MAIKSSNENKPFAIFFPGIARMFSMPFIWACRIIKMPLRFYNLAKTVQQLQIHAGQLEANLQAYAEKHTSVLDAQRVELAALREKVMLLQNEWVLGRKDKISSTKASEMRPDTQASLQSEKEYFPFNYYAFENHFRGSREFIKGLQKVYLPWLQSAFQKNQADYVLDLGCGRGEFLELLAENNVPGVGVDVNAENIVSCLKLNFKAQKADALSYLRGIKNDSLIGVVAFQVVEHLEFDYLNEMIVTAYAKIRKGGCIILETVNPYSFFSLRSFFIDPSHQKPIPPVTLEFLVKDAGFEALQFHYYCPVDAEQKLHGEDENTRKLNELLFNFQGYAVIAEK